MASTSTTEPDLDKCQCCDAEPAVGTAAIPGVPMSITWGRKCLEAGAVPLWTADATVGMCCNPAAPSWSQLADWFREQVVYVHGQYVRMDTLALQTYDCDHSETAAEHIDPHGSCPLCFKGQVVGLAEYRTQVEGV